MKNFTTYQSPFTWRYGSDQMRHIWSEENKYRIWRRIWITLAEEQSAQGLVSKKELADLKKQQENIDIQRILEIEKDTRHDVVAAIREFAEKAKIGGGKIHLGATSMDIVDNADSIRMKQSLDIIEKQLREILKHFAEKIQQYADAPCMGYTHLQPAEPTTIGYRLALYAQDFLEDLSFLNFVKTHLKAKGFKGAVGTQASYKTLLTNQQIKTMEEKVMEKLSLETVLIANQVGLRKADFLVVQHLVSISQSLYKFAFDMRIMQSAGFNEWQEPFSKNQVGSSAMPFKRNPRKAEQICSLARFVESLSSNAWENASLSILERTLDDSANRRAYIPEMFLALEDILISSDKIVSGLIIHDKQVKNNLNKFAPFSATEAILMKAVNNGADRQVTHELLRDLSMQAWNAVQNNQLNSLPQLLKENKTLQKHISQKEITKLLDVTEHIGTAPSRAKQLVKIIQKTIQ